MSADYAEPDIYEHDMRGVLALIDALRAIDVEDTLIEAGTRIAVGSKNDYLIGVLTYEEDEWRFAPHVDAVMNTPAIRCGYCDAVGGVMHAHRGGYAHQGCIDQASGASSAVDPDGIPTEGEGR